MNFYTLIFPIINIIVLVANIIVIVFVIKFLRLLLEQLKK
ncbi:hypothetical protein O163_04655 [Caldanaerobacter subterraneus subsp. yonseiensis KB-1]|uniref:Uncharacterized protein n=1 Tax=Caldanaerobacter subterraneus subsp. yonseiensis KB-1 TaxID=1388761 RepID=U5CHR7_CALSX|nr:hypothetical protein O163_04655 [Caldanaerobacter subterraneus subsp. yonseiensis KB-1]